MTEFDDKKIEEFIRESFEENYNQLKLDSGRAITPEIKDTALNQVLIYWKKMRDIATKVTDTEVRLSLPNVESPKEREFSIEGVVDIVQDADTTMMYDIKTHDADQVRANFVEYEQQLNVYAYIWTELRKQKLDGMAIIATNYPDSVTQALASFDEERIRYALQDWDPLVPITYDRDKVKDTIKEFGKTVDMIEDGVFSPAPLTKLNETESGNYRVKFATRVCRNCDARFSCSSYRKYAWTGTHRTSEDQLARYFNDFVNDMEQETWRSAGLEAARDPDEIRADFTR